MAYLEAAGGYRKELKPSGDCIGSAEGADIRVSAVIGIVDQHFKVGLTPGGWQVQPLAPTSVNGTPITELTPLAPGDRITAGNLGLVFGDSAAGELAAVPAGLSTEADAGQAKDSPAIHEPPLNAAACAALSWGAPPPAVTPTEESDRPKWKLPKLPTRAAAALLLAGGAFAAWKAGVLPFGNGADDAHFDLLAQYAPAGTDFAASIDVQEIGSFYDHWRAKLSPELPSLADASSELRAKTGVGIESFERVSFVGNHQAKLSASANPFEKGFFAVLTFAEGTDVATLLESNLDGVIKQDTGDGITLYRSPDDDQFAMRLVEGRHLMLGTEGHIIEPKSHNSAKPHINALRKSGMTFVVSGAVPSAKLRQMATPSTLPTHATLGVDLPAGIDLVAELEFASKDEAVKAGEMWEQLQGMAGNMLGSDTKGKVGKELLSRVQVERHGSSQEIEISVTEGEMARLAQDATGGGGVGSLGMAGQGLEEFVRGFTSMVK